MPTYEYACKKCNQTFEVVQSFSDDPLTKHQKCGGELRKVFGNIGITFKGSGFYKTDSRSSSKATASSSDSGSSSSDKASSSDSSSTATPAAAPAKDKKSTDKGSSSSSSAAAS